MHLKRHAGRHHVRPAMRGGHHALHGRSELPGSGRHRIPSPARTGFRRSCLGPLTDAVGLSQALASDPSWTRRVLSAYRVGIAHARNMSSRSAHPSETVCRSTFSEQPRLGVSGPGRAAAFAFPVMHCARAGKRPWRPVGDHTSGALMHDLRVCARHARTSQASRRRRDLGKRVTAIYWGPSGFPLPAFFETEVAHVGGSLAGASEIVLNAGAAAVKATPLRGRLQAEP